MKKVFALCLGLLLVPQTALSMDAATVIMLQSTLNKHGFSVGEPDGQIGPATRRGLKDFSEIYGISSDPQSVLEFVVRQSYANRVEITDEKLLERIKEEVSENLRDPSSAMIRNVFRVKSASDDIFCGEVNGKNAYGAYAGYTWFYGMNIVQEIYTIIQIDSPNKLLVAELTCLMAFPKGEGS